MAGRRQRSLDPEERIAAYSQIQIKVLEDAVTIPLADSITYNAKRANLQGDFLDFLASYVWLNDGASNSRQRCDCSWAAAQAAAHVLPCRPLIAGRPQ